MKHRILILVLRQVSLVRRHQKLTFLKKERNQFFYTGDLQLFFEFSVCASFSHFNTNRLFTECWLTRNKYPEICIFGTSLFRTYPLLFVVMVEEVPALWVVGPSFIPVLQKCPGAVDVAGPVRVSCKHTLSQALGHCQHVNLQKMSPKRCIWSNDVSHGHKINTKKINTLVYPMHEIAFLITCHHPLFKTPTSVIEVVDVRRAGDFGNEAWRSTRPADETVPLRRTGFIYSWKWKHAVTQTQHSHLFLNPVTSIHTCVSAISVIFYWTLHVLRSPASSGFLQKSENISLMGPLNIPCCERVRVWL